MLDDYTIRTLNSCGNCNCIKKLKHKSPFGGWMLTCKKFKIGRNPDSQSCDRFESV